MEQSKCKMENGTCLPNIVEASLANATAECTSKQSNGDFVCEETICPDSDPPIFKKQIQETHVEDVKGDQNTLSLQEDNLENVSAKFCLNQSTDTLPEVSAELKSLSIQEENNKEGSKLDDEQVEELFLPVLAPPASASEETWQKQAIRVAAALTSADLWRLRQLSAAQLGLVADTLRAQAWPVMVGANPLFIEPGPAMAAVREQRYYQQVVLDVQRTLRRFPPDMSDSQRRVLQEKLIMLIIRVFLEFPDLHYYQGFHDIGLTLLLVMNEETAYSVLRTLVHTHLRDFLDSDMQRTSALLELFYPIIGAASPELKRFLIKAELGTIFCLPWQITWFAHVLESVRPLLRLYDLFLATHPLMPLYLAAALVHNEKEAVLALPCEMPAIHSFLSHVPARADLEPGIQEALRLFFFAPPCVLVAQNQNLFKTSSILHSHAEFEASVLAHSLLEPEALQRKSRSSSPASSKFPSAQPSQTRGWALSSRLMVAAVLAVAGALAVPILRNAVYQ